MGLRRGRHRTGRQVFPEALTGLSEFSPLVGIFSQRGKGRPNRIGVSICRLLSVEGVRLKVRGLDAIDGTPVLDIKTVMTGFLPRGAIVEPEWAKELMKDYWL